MFDLGWGTKGPKLVSLQLTCTNWESPTRRPIFLMSSCFFWCRPHQEKVNWYSIPSCRPWFSAWRSITNSFVGLRRGDCLDPTVTSDSWFRTSLRNQSITILYNRNHLASSMQDGRCSVPDAWRWRHHEDIPWQRGTRQGYVVGHGWVLKCKKTFSPDYLLPALPN
jgi:hypothetical protein